LGVGLGCWGFRDHGFVDVDSTTREHEQGHDPVILHSCYRITVPVNKRGRPVSGSINPSIDNSSSVLGVDKRYWFWNGLIVECCVYAKILFFVLNGTSNAPLTTIFGAAFLVF
ncbi:hypothetical protein, partial [Corynebacterium belfantii]|uniref:hypothetical protein n=1 Tax=Corynebacterium belfantii TaxID=2014537 RepID=UPI001A7F00BB